MATNKSTRHKIHEAINELHALGTKVTEETIGKHLGVSKQRIHQILSETDDVSILDHFQQRGKLKKIAGELKKLDTKCLKIEEIKALPIKGLSELSDHYLYKLIKKHEIPHSNSRLDKVNNITNTQNYTARELFEMTGETGSFRYFRGLLYLNKIPFKNERQNRKSIADILGKLNSIDTSKYTIKELSQLVEVKQQNLCQILKWHHLPYKKTQAKPKRTSTALNRLTSIDTSQHTVKELHELVGGNIRNLQKVLAKHNLPYKKTKTGPKKKTRRPLTVSNKPTSDSNRRSKEEMAPIWNKLHSIDTSQYTAKELLEFLENKVRHNVMLKYLDRQGLKYKYEMGRSRKSPILNRLTSIDTSQHTVKELHELVGGNMNIRSLQNNLAKHNLPYKKTKTGPKPKN
ncbi:hypothetical protein BCEN4_740076 [Burkholderia cenocepacia]|uniref:hypothetical protein n=1 Tax=Burkholderia cenocepacia TaxID=95486 RepID=UPI00192BF006|nr:hypothetical protein [Burkholderia cenocepacia]CAD9227949.1 hypothetical protein BCEN4_740076 [Burkholderia cenocepacia]